MATIRDAMRSAIRQAKGDRGRAVRIYHAWFEARCEENQGVDWLYRELVAEGYSLERTAPNDAVTAKRIASEIMRLSGPDPGAASRIAAQRLDPREYPTDAAIVRHELTAAASTALAAIFDQEWSRATGRLEE